MKRLILFIIFAFPISVSGQNPIGFAYDAAGNRIKREIVASKNNVFEKTNIAVSSAGTSLKEKGGNSTVGNKLELVLEEWGRRLELL